MNWYISCLIAEQCGNIVRELRSQHYIPAAFRIGEAHLSAVQSLTSYILTGAAVKIVACERMSDMRKVNTYLMSSASLKLYFKQRVSIAVHYFFIMCCRRLTVLPDTAQDYRFRLTCDRSINSSRSLGDTVNGSIVDFPAAPLDKICRVSIFGDNAKSRSIAVEPVYRSECQIAEHRRKAVAESIALMLYRGVNGHSRGFIENNYILVLKGDRNGEQGIRFEQTCILQGKDDLVIRINYVDAADKAAVAGDAVFSALQSAQKPF